MIQTFGDVDERSRAQLATCLGAAQEREGAEPLGVLCADHHPGYSQPIGGVVAYRHHVSPSGVGYDIACGNMAAKTNLRADDLEAEMPRLMDEVWRRISFGIGRNNPEPVSSPVIDAIAESPVLAQRQLAQMAANQLGTVGAGNHYVDIFRDEDGWVWVGVHFGSRGFGYKTCTGFLALAQNKAFDERVSEGGMDAAPVLLDTRTDLGQAYLAGMALAGDYAYAGREWVTRTVAQEILGGRITDEVHNHHNFAWRERHNGEWFTVIRKGATPAYPGQRGFVGGTMGEISVVLEGVESSLAARALYSTVHGAGRVMSRTEAAGKIKWRRLWSCTTRDCEGTLPVQTPLNEDGSNPRCVRCGSTMQKRRVGEVKRVGKVNWPSVQAQIKAQGIELRGAGADEAPEAYKRLPDVLTAHEDTIKILHTLTPMGVAMAGINEFDPYKD